MDYGYGSGYDDDGYYDTPITYGEPCYYTPPIAVTFVFDYFTYEPYGPYVDIVFWRDGRRYRHEPWHDHGRRITSEDIHSRDWHNRVRGSELSSHRDKLREHHNISHPDSYYGMKSPSNRQMQQPPRQMEQRPQWGRGQSRQVKQQPQQVQQRPPWGQGQPRQVKQRPQQVEQRPQSEQRQSRQTGPQHQQGGSQHQQGEQ